MVEILKHHTVAQANTYAEIELDEVMAELENLKKQSKFLQAVNDLHGRLAGALDVNGMIEAFSIWLMPLVTHELIGYRNFTRDKKHFFCSGHGPFRRMALAFAEEIADSDLDDSGAVISRDGHYAHRWTFESAENSGIFLILKEGTVLSDEEIDLINNSLTVLIDSLSRGVEYEDLFDKACTDSLTGLANRRVFDERIKGILDGARRYGRNVSLLSMDLDFFKEVNDNLGHARGDSVLCEFANVLRQSVRNSDLLIRMGGDEFLVVLNDTSKKNAHNLAERICKSVDSLNIQVTQSIKLGVSIGVTELEKEETLAEWLERTDDVLYHAKADGRGRVSGK
ncbi:MAG: GGDEF domain-containing protein [Desulfotalea sp.]